MTYDVAISPPLQYDSKKLLSFKILNGVWIIITHYFSFVCYMLIVRYFKDKTRYFGFELGKVIEFKFIKKLKLLFLNLPKYNLLWRNPCESLAQTVKFREDSTVMGWPRRDLILDANKESNTKAWPRSCRPPGTIRSWPMPSYTKCNYSTYKRAKNLLLLESANVYQNT